MIYPVVTPTPVQEISWPEAGDNRIFIKREDLLPYSFGGNKVRIGLAFFEDMKRKGADAMIMYGSPRSNLCRVLSGLCSGEGIASVMISAEEEDASVNAPTAFNERIAAGLGTEILRCTKDRIPETVDAAKALLANRGKKPYYIYGSRYGTGNEAAAGSAYADAFGEILADRRKTGVPFDYLYTPYGTGATMGGLVTGAVEHSDEAPFIIGISISSRSPERAWQVLADTVSATVTARGSLHGAFCDTAPSGGDDRGAAFPGREFDAGRLGRFCVLESGYRAGGYGCTSPEIEETIRLMLRRHSIPMDPTYTGKAFAGMIRDLREKGIRGKNILFLHTGGLPLFFDYLGGKTR